MKIDFGKTSADYLRYRVPFHADLPARLRVFGIGKPGQRVLDVGAGTGLLGVALRQNGCEVISLDLSRELLSAGESRDHHLVARAEAIPLKDESVDVVTAAQCWHWFDRTAAPREMRRVLRSGGQIAAIYQTYVPLPGSIAEETEKLILRHRPGWRHANSTGLNGQVLRDLQISGFRNIESFSFDVEIVFSPESWRGYIRTTSAVGASMPARQLQEFEREHEAMLKDRGESLQIPHRVFAAVARKRDLRV